MRCAVLGSPIAHSLSPALHRAAYAELGLADWTYDRFEVTEAGLADFVAGCDDTWRGLSLTMPLKVAALELGEVDRLAGLVGAANTLLFTPDGRRVFNTDVGGLVSAVRRVWHRPVRTATILGAGATARSALLSAAELGAAQVLVVARDVSKAEGLRALADTVGVRLQTQGWHDALPDVDVLVSTVVAGAADARADELAGCARVVFDAVYDPWPTALSVAAERAGRAVVNGLDLLAGQAVLQVELMTGGRVAPEVLLSAGRAALGA